MAYIVLMCVPLSNDSLTFIHFIIKETERGKHASQTGCCYKSFFFAVTLLQYYE